MILQIGINLVYASSKYVYESYKANQLCIQDIKIKPNTSIMTLTTTADSKSL